MIKLILRKLLIFIVCFIIISSLSINTFSTSYYLETQATEKEEIIITPSTSSLNNLIFLEKIEFKDYFYDENINQTEELNLYLSYLYCKANEINGGGIIGAEKINLFLIEEEIEYISSLLEEYKDFNWNIRKKEYPIATEVWLFLKNEMGWSDTICAGVMGNMMAEVGGQTFNLDYNLWDDSGHYYGICQWVDYYCPEVMGTSLQQQLQYLKETVEFNMNEWNVPYEKFLNSKTPEEAALLFAMGYERCNTVHYYIRTVNAVKAYEYYTSDTRE
jgi:hypothetical protein